MNDKQLAIQTAPSIAVFETQDIEDAIRAGLPNGNELSTAQIHAAAIVARTSDLNPFMREVHITNTGVMKAASVGLATANEWLEKRGDQAEWVYTHIGAMSETELREQLEAHGQPSGGQQPELLNRLCAALGIKLSTDVAVLTKMYLRNSHEQWRKSVALALALGATKEEVRAEYGLRPKPDYQAWGIVRFNEQKDSKNGGPTAAQKWEAMDAKYSRLERAKKRGRTACVNALLPVTTDQRRAMHAIFRNERASESFDEFAPPTQQWDIVDGDPTEPSPSTASNAPDGAPAEQRSDPPPDDDVVDGEMSEAPAERVSDQHAERTPPAAAKPTSPVVPERISTLYNRLTARRVMYEEKGWLNSEKQDNLVIGIIKRLCGKDDELQRTALRLLTGQEHWGDVPLGRRRALLKDWLKLGEDLKPCAEAQADFDAIKAYHAEAKPA